MSTKPNLLTKFPSRMAYRRPQAALRPETMVTDSAAHAVCGLDASIFVCDQSYGNSWPQSRQTTYVPVTDAAAMLRRSLPRTVMGKLRRWCQQPKTRSNRLISPPRLTRRSMPPAESPPLFQRETVFG